MPNGGAAFYISRHPDHNDAQKGNSVVVIRDLSQPRPNLSVF
jgi:hypothetical protein